MTTVWCEHAVIGGRVRSSVLIEISGGRFASVECDVDAGAAQRLSGITIPGMANAHSHAFHRALRSRTQAARGSFWTWRELMYRAAARLQPESYHRLARGVFGEMALAGIACVGEFHYLHHQPDGTRYDEPNAMGQALLQAASDVGIRITLLDTLYLHGGLEADGYSPPSGTQRRFDDGSADSWIERISALIPTDGQRIGAAVHSVRAVDREAMSALARWAGSNRAPVHAHVSEQVAENAACIAHHGQTPVGVFVEAGLLSERFAAVHATHLSDTDVAALAAGKATVVMCPTTERDLGDGIGPTATLTAAGVPLCLGSDSHAVIDLFEEARCVELHERLRSEQRGIHTANALLGMATAAGHRSLGWDDAGSIEVGARADLVTVALDSVRTAGLAAATGIEGLVFAAAASDVSDVFVDGRHVVSDGAHTLINVTAELDAAIKELMDHA